MFNKKIFSGISFATNTVWDDICEQLNYRMSAKAIHTFVQLGRHNILDKLGLSKIKNVLTISEPTLDNKNDSLSGKLNKNIFN